MGKSEIIKNPQVRELPAYGLILEDKENRRKRDSVASVFLQEPKTAKRVKSAFFESKTGIWLFKMRQITLHMRHLKPQMPGTKLQVRRLKLQLARMRG
jgi:hypothetical protein